MLGKTGQPVFSLSYTDGRGNALTLALVSVAITFAAACGGGSTASPSAAEQSRGAVADQSEAVAAESEGEPETSATTESASAVGEATPSSVADDEVGPVWQALAPLAGGARQETAVVALNGEIYVLGGFDARGRIVAAVEAYDPQRDRWRTLADLPVPLHHANAAVTGGKIYVVGFLTGAFVADGRTFIYDPQTDSWASGQPMPAGTERGASGLAVLEGKIYLSGGFRLSAVDDFSVYTPDSDTWEILPELPAARDHLVGGGIEGLIYIAGGRAGTISTVTGRLDVFDPATASWSMRASMPTARGGAAGAVLAGRLYVIGGEGNSAAATGVFAQVEAYDPEADGWTSLPAMATPRHGTGAAPLQNQVYVPGGATQQGFGAVASNESLTP